MVAETISVAYDGVGRLVSRPSKKRYPFFNPTFPMGTYLSQPLSIQCENLEEVRLFLAQCRYVTDQEQFNQRDYWMPPQEFEKRKKGDCDDFALWTWRQLLSMGYEARFVVGEAGRYGNGHAWVTFAENGRTFLVESMIAWVESKLPRLSTLRYQPGVSVSWDGDRLRYYEHEKRIYDLSLREMLPLVCEWLPWWVRSGTKGYYFWGRYLAKRALNKITARNPIASGRSTGDDRS